MTHAIRRILAGLLLLPGLSQAAKCQDLTPEQRRFMGLPAVGPLNTKPISNGTISPTPPAPVNAPPASEAASSRSGALDGDGPEMSFRLVGTGGASCCEWIEADGVITSRTPQAFKHFVGTLGKNGSTLQASITLNSPGGDLFAALTLGREIRRGTRMWTAVGRTERVRKVTEAGIEAYRLSDGVCLSACVLVFMGGKTRDYQRGSGSGEQNLAFRDFALDQPASVIGRHSADAMAAGGVPTPGLLRLVLEGYAAEMGVDPSIVALMETAAQPGGLHVIEQDEADRLGLNTPSAARTKWNLSVNRGDLVLYGTGDNRWTHYTLGIQCLQGHAGAMEYTVAVPADPQGEDATHIEDGFRRGIQAVEVQNGSDGRTQARLASIRYLPGQLLLTTLLDPSQVSTLQEGKAVIQFDTSHDLENALPSISFASPQVTDAIGALVRNCPGS